MRIFGVVNASPDSLATFSVAATYEESLARLVHQGLLERREAIARTAHTEELEGLLRKAAACSAKR